MKKITIIGDIMVEPPFMQQVTKDGVCDFYPSLAPLKTLFRESDYVIGNLETPLAGEEAGYTSRIVSFNAPDCLAEALKKLGLDAVTTSNNHAVDRGYEGLARTIDVLDKVGLAHTGTYKKDFTGDRNLYFTVGDTTVALLNYTYAVNYGLNKERLSGNWADSVNKLRPLSNVPLLTLPMPQPYLDTKAFIQELLQRDMTWEEGIKLKLAMHIPTVTVDDNVYEDELDEYMRRIGEDYALARQKADLVLFYPHAGGQFNEEPGKYSVRLMEKAVEMGFDAVLMAHSHTTQKACYNAEIPCFYSLGNVTMSPGTFYSHSACLPEYGLAVHLYLEDKKIAKTTFSIFKMVEENGEALRVVPVTELYKTLDSEGQAKLLTDVDAVYARVAGKAHTGLQEEYEL